MQDILYRWDFSTNKQKWSIWYISALAVIIGFVIWWFLSRQYGLSFILLLVCGIYIFNLNNSPERVEVVCTKQGIQVENTFYEYTRIRSFSFLSVWKEILFLRLSLVKGWAYRNIDIDINEKISEDLKQILPQFIEQDDTQELSFTERLIHMFKL